MLSQSFFPNFGQEPFPKIAGKALSESNIKWQKYFQSSDKLRGGGWGV